MTLTTDGGDTDDSNDLALIAHQGFAHSYPPNTLAAMRGAADDGADMIEIDLQPCTSASVVEPSEASWKTTISPSAHGWMSISIISAPSSAAPRVAASVFGG